MDQFHLKNREEFSKIESTAHSNESLLSKEVEELTISTKINPVIHPDEDTQELTKVNPETHPNQLPLQQNNQELTKLNPITHPIDLSHLKNKQHTRTHTLLNDIRIW